MGIPKNGYTTFILENFKFRQAVTKLRTVLINSIKQNFY